MKKWFLLFFMFPFIGAVSFEDIKNRDIRFYELVDIMVDLGGRGELPLMERWRNLSPKSFKGVDFTRAYSLAAERLLREGITNAALDAYTRAYQQIGKHKEKEKAAYMTAFLLYAADKRAEALFYINRAVEQSEKDSPLEKNIASLKRRVVWSYFSRFDNLPDNAISSIAFDGDDVWIGMWSGGIARYTRSASEIETFTPKNTVLPSFYIRDILVQKDKVWVGSHPGLSVYDKKTGKWNSFPEFSNISVKRLIDDGNNIYASTLYKGVYQSEDRGRSWKNIINDKTVLDLFKNGDKLFIATADQGVYLYENGQLSRFLPDVAAKSIIIDETGNRLWVGSYGQGLFSVNIDTGKVLKTYGVAELGSDYIETLLYVDGILWVGTLDKGALYFDGKKWTSLGLRDGLPGLELTTITREKEHLWFGTLAGGIGIYLFKEIAPPEVIK